MAVVATLIKGYDLDYSWKQMDSGPVMDAASYYLQARETVGEPPGQWCGPGVRALGLRPGQIIDRAPYDLLFGERKAPDGTPLGRPPGSGGKLRTCLRSCWSASRMTPPRAAASCGWRRPAGPGRARCSST